jgi:hypothetical protein
MALFVQGFVSACLQDLFVIERLSLGVFKNPGLYGYLEFSAGRISGVTTSSH